MLDALTGSTPPGLIYRALVATPDLDVQAIATRVGLPADEVDAVLVDLEGQRLVVAQAGRWEAVSPTAVVAEAQADHRRTMAQLEVAARALGEVYASARRHDTGLPAMRVSYDAAEIHEEWFALQRNTHGELQCLERPPYLTVREEDRPALSEQIGVQADRIRAGVTYRTIYEKSVLDDELYSQLVVDNLALGERVRMLSEVPVKCVIGDRRTAMMVLDDRPGYVGGVLILERSALVDALAAVFDTLWGLAVPINDAITESEPLDPIDRDIISLMAVGATDDLIARRLDVSRRTVVRRSAAILHRLGASNRFQAGMQATRRGWL